MKGQIFLITSVIVILALVILKNSIDITSIIENKRNLEIGLERLEFENARDELTRAIVYSYNFSNNMTGKIDDYVKFARDYFNSRTIDFEALGIASMYPTANVSNSTRINFTVSNFIGREIDFMNLTFSATNVSTTLSKLQDGISVNANSTFTTAATINYTLTVFWNTTQENRTETINIPAEIGKGKFIGFYDIRLQSSRLTQRDKITKIIDLPT